ncbi:MAG: PolC-type DNA polymerase III [Anaerovoracaceae bacterium]|nr:PolC-type DNA polymerase III [Bacillota bacterium]MDY2671373.1 PolC-type DNA polymerase III [Anaerovoracaceae bacterium]
MQETFNNILKEACLASAHADQAASGRACSASLKDAAFDRGSGRLDISLEMNFIMDYGAYEHMLDAVKENLPFVSSVKCRTVYNDIEEDTPAIIRGMLPYMAGSVSGAASLIHTVDCSSIRLEGGRAVVGVLGERAEKQLNDAVAPAASRIMRDRFGRDVQIEFCNIDNRYDERVKDKESKNAQELEVLRQETETAARENAKKAAAQAENSQQKGYGGYGGGSWNGGGASGGQPKRRKRAYEGPVKGNLILGKPIDCDPIPIKNITGSEQHVAIEGTVFASEEKELKNGGRFIQTFCVTDNTDSICVKCFVSAQKKADFDEYIPNNAYVRIAGHAEYDTFEKMTVIMADSIELGEKPERHDTCERKRVELHVHTKMSQIDGLMDVKDLVKQAIKWGHKAVAVTDHGVVQAFPDAAEAAGDDIKVLYGCEGYLVNAIEHPDGTLDYKSNPSYHVILIAKNQTGLKNLYKLVSFSFLDYHYKRPRMPKQVISQYREGLIIGSACEAGEVFRTMESGASDEELEKVASFYDYLEVQPRTNNWFKLEKGQVQSEEELLDYNRRIVALGEKLGKPVVATSDAHYKEPEDYIYRNIIMAAHGFKDLSESPRLWLRTTDEMLEEFSYLGREKAEEIVIDNPQMIADSVDVLRPVPKGKFPPKIDGAEERLRTRCYEKAHSIYGDPLPELVEQRLDKELHSIIDNGYAVMYVAAEMLVQKSLSDGYLVGSRGSVGSSFAATMDGITEVNPLPPHYVCPKCKHSEFMLDSDYGCGADMPDKVCPVCGTKYKKDGFNIPFETFLGFNGTKEPDIDLNFAGEYQPVAHKYVETIFGAKNVFKAGTISTIKEKTAQMYVRKYFEERGRTVNKCELQRLALGCTGVRKTTGQHPGGIVVVPDDHEIYEFCPVMHPSEGAVKDITTTHFDYHKIDQNLLKLDILGHDVPSMIRMLQDLTGVAPEDIPLDDKKVMDLFLGTEPLDIKIDDYRQRHGTFGIPEFGTAFTRQMLDETKPAKFDALVRISGFSHGTDVWRNNAEEFIKSGEATMDDAIATRDDIMNYLIAKGVPKAESFQIMEKVRKGKGLTEEREALMREHDVPEWYIESCKRIKYMFPRAHAAAYVMMSYRIAYFKVYYPPEFYATHFTTKIDFFNADVIMGGMQSVLDRMDAIRKMGKDATNKEQEEVLVYEVAYEMYARGYEFLPVEFGKSRGLKFWVEDGKVRLPFRALEGMGETAAQSIEEEYSKREFSSVEDLVTRTGVNTNNVEVLRSHGVLDGIPDSDQISLFDLACSM